MNVWNLLFALISLIFLKVNGDEEIVVSNPSFLTKFNQLIQKTPKQIQVEKKSIQRRFLDALAQLIIVAHAAYGVSVKFVNWKEFFPIEYM